jgi:hypothetical protein
MEIQNQNNLLQMLFSARDNTSLAVNSDKMTPDFANMLKLSSDTSTVLSSDEVKSLPGEKAETLAKAKDSKSVSANRVANDYKSDSKVETKSDNGNKVKKAEKNAEAGEKEPVSSANDSREAKSSEQDADVVEAKGVNEPEDDVQTVGDASGIEQNEEIQSDKADDFAEAGEPANLNILTTFVADEMLPQAVAVQADDTDFANDAQAVEGVLSVADDNKNAKKIISSEMPVFDETANAVSAEPLNVDEAMRFEQAKLLDEKLNLSHKLKISVDVKEEKVADVMERDILQNRFEIDSLFQAVDDDTSLQEALLPDVEAEVADDAQVIEMTTPEVTVADAAWVDATDYAASQTSIETSEVIVPTQELAMNGNAQPLRAETVARTNDVSARDGLNGLSKEVVEQVKVNITKSAIKGVDTIDVQLKPEDLGKIQIKLHIAKDGRLQAEFVAGRADTLEMLQKEAGDLAKAFSDAGYDTDSRSFNFSFQNEDQAQGQQKEASELSRFIGDTLEQEAENIAGNDNLVYDPALGINIRV